MVYVSGVMFRWIIASVLLTRLVIKTKKFLDFVIEKPKVPHLHGSGPLSFDCVVDNANGGCVVDVNRCRQLWVPEFFKDRL